ncbi:MAG: hypothetical protein K8M05_27975, partial [Deltaproteobacteria bacterium]|nr:hypothetical protein [Kofleriaceae bacterium]
PPPIAPLPKARPGAHRPVVAFGLSFGATVGLMIAAEKGAFDEAPTAAIGLFVIAPSAGRWYVGEIGLIGMAMRLAGVGLVFGSIGDHGPENTGMLVTAATLAVAGTLYDMVGAGVTAHRQNKRRWAAMPAALASPHGSVTPGLAVGGTF